MAVTQWHGIQVLQVLLLKVDMSSVFSLLPLFQVMEDLLHS